MEPKNQIESELNSALRNIIFYKEKVFGALPLRLNRRLLRVKLIVQYQCSAAFQAQGTILDR
jgi:hypothetical protein